MKILVIGSEGNIGQRLIPYLRERHTVYRIDQIQGVGDDYTTANIMNIGDMFPIFEEFKPDVVYLLAAMVSRVTCEISPCLTVDTNLSGLNNVIQLCKRFKAKLIYFSTSEVYGNIGGKLSEDRECKPNNLYGLTKYLGEQLVRYELPNAVIVRPFMFYDEYETHGDHRSAMIRFVTALRNKEKITVHVDSIRSWMHMTDAVRMLERIAYVTGETVNIGSEEVITTKQLALKLCNALGLKYDDYVIETELPEKMTLTKYPDVRKQYKLTRLKPVVDIDAGIKMVINESISSHKETR